MGLRERMAKWSKNTAGKQNFLSKKIINKRISTIKDKTLQYLCKNDRIVLVHNLINNLYYVHMYVKQSVVSNSVRFCAMDGSPPVPLSMGVSWHEYWSVLPRSPPGDLPNPGIKPSSPVTSALAGRFFTLHHLESPW